MPGEDTPSSEPVRPITFGDRMRQCRMALGWSQTELARRAGIDLAWINRLESGERQNISLAAAKRIARALRVGLDYLADTFGDSEDTPASVDMMGVGPTLAGAGLSGDNTIGSVAQTRRLP